MIKKSVPSYFKERRDRLMKNNSGAAFLFPSAQEVLRNPDVGYPFRQESNLYYLTGFDEPESFLILAPQSDKPGEYKSVLFVREKDSLKELWEGERYGVDGAKSVFGVNETYPISALKEKLSSLLRPANQVYYRIGNCKKTDELVFNSLNHLRLTYGRSGRGLLPIYDSHQEVGELRLYKSKAEIEILQKACDISSLAHKTAMQEVKPGMNEYEVQALMDYVFIKNGCARNGYGSIVASGKNACCLHYTSNNEVMREGDLLLIDAGGEFDYYTSDITRTFPVGHLFSKEQAQIYDLVLSTQKSVIDIAKPGLAYEKLHETACDLLTEGLLSMGFLKGKKSEILKDMSFKRLYPHGTGHWLGMDVHDVGLYKKNNESRRLEPGMVFTVEPGLYFQLYDQEVANAFKGIGIRIEDNILITDSGNINLTAAAPKERTEIERLRAKAF